MSDTQRVWLVGVDCGSTTTSLLVATARVLRNCVTGRMELAESVCEFRPDPVFTPFAAGAIDEGQLAARLDGWLAECHLSSDQIASVGVLVTGLAAESRNAACVERLVRARFGDVLVARADDPCLESWLAFMGNCQALSRAHPGITWLNVDIGGGTTNLALGRQGEVQSVGCWRIGARHLRFEPGGYRLTGWSTWGERLLGGLGISRTLGDELSPSELDSILDFYHAGLLACIQSRSEEIDRLGCRFLEQVAFDTRGASEPAIVFSGGVGELVYRLAQRRSVPTTTYFGDLGIDLARRIARSDSLGPHLTRFVPTTQGRATVYGLTVHSTEVSGATVFLSDARLLPLRDLPILARISDDVNDAQLLAFFKLGASATGGACLWIDGNLSSHRSLRDWGTRLARAWRDSGWSPSCTLVLFVAANVGHALGQYVTDWGANPGRLIVVDEIPDRGAQFASLGTPRAGIIPVAFYGPTA